MEEVERLAKIQLLSNPTSFTGYIFLFYFLHSELDDSGGKSWNCRFIAAGLKLKMAGSRPRSGALGFREEGK
ncbi:hypothetical protein RRG08_023590 [Elysia crispata]|uniref:Uncharacterized protein n=1 Tax=Elysia crispata TaxID=231223 RepID=A0AAE1B8A6_9GAST|nr:hypothetical protein RRG08_023590 [Elysia crispata]